MIFCRKSKWRGQDIQTINNSIVVDRHAFIFADGALFCSIGVGAYKRGKNTCARTWRSKMEGGSFSGEYGTSVNHCAAVPTRTLAALCLSTLVPRQKCYYILPKECPIQLFGDPQFCLNFLLRSIKLDLIKRPPGVRCALHRSLVTIFTECAFNYCAP